MCDQNEAKISVIDVNARLVIRTVDLLDHHSEFVKSGAVEEDSELTLFHGVPFEDGEEILFFWEADFIEDKTIPPF
ncbi:hypothetical protein GWO43_15715 [candidate division KSB1 bacterium]|nr:hypothetical protein [candidate division KSB1 bacterium]NIS25402.1 hypothetical protein [candidate division KSB1 bacterium]NIT72290.1 hypothetical protein [candidate division KSB1 bacterium]NIU25697.1 hypothetical protein [candidate division KSB1 bacterium]NIU93447.1 hypothetical protein [candidate division KSB1 bacterium]